MAWGGAGLWLMLNALSSLLACLRVVVRLEWDNVSENVSQTGKFHMHENWREWEGREGYGKLRQEWTSSHLPRKGLGSRGSEIGHPL